jgi:hypothetical protein
MKLYRIYTEDNEALIHILLVRYSQDIQFTRRKAFE